MPICSKFVELSAAELTLYAIIQLLYYCSLSRLTNTLSTSWSIVTWSWPSHCLSEHFTLHFPFIGFAAYRFLWRFLCGCGGSNWWGLVRGVSISPCSILSFSQNSLLPLLLHVKYLSLLQKHFLTDLLMSHEGIWYELSAACWTLFPLFISISILIILWLVACILI